METVPCNLCGSTRHRALYSKPDVLFFPEEFFTVVECSGCGLGFVNPRPTPAEMPKYYPSAFYSYFDEQWDFHQNRYAAEASFLREITERTGPKRLLDVGCANGDFPRYMQSLGWQVEGVEISANARPITDFPVYNREFPQLPLFQPHYDAVTAWAVLEHVHDPKAYFAKVAEVLKPGGLFAFLVTNLQSISSRYLFQEDVPRHLYFFTNTAVERYINNVGLELIAMDCSDKIYGMVPFNWLHFYAHRLRGHRDVSWKQFEAWSVRFSDYLRRRGIRRTPLSMARFALEHPFTVIDRLLQPAFARYQMLRKSYGIATYVARKL